MSSQTMLPFLNGVKVSFLLLIIHCLANSCAAKASCILACKCFSFPSIVGNLVYLNEVGIETGESPNISSNGVFDWSACH